MGPAPSPSGPIPKIGSEHVGTFMSAVCTWELAAAQTMKDGGGGMGLKKNTPTPPSHTAATGFPLFTNAFPSGGSM